MTDTTTERFKRFRETFVTSNLPNDVLLELIESYLKSDCEESAIMPEVLHGQLSLFDEITWRR